MVSKGYVAIPGSGREPLPGATKSGPCDPQESVQVTVVLRPRPRGKKVTPLAKLISRGERLTRSKFAALYGADTKDVDRVRAFARAHGLKVSRVNRGARTVMLSGSAGAFNQAFQVDLGHYESPQGAYRGRTGPVYVPSSLKV